MVKSTSSGGQNECRTPAIIIVVVQLVLEPDNADVYHSRGVLHEIKGDFDLAIADYKTVLAIDPAHDEALKSLEAAERN